MTSPSDNSQDQRDHIAKDNGTSSRIALWPGLLIAMLGAQIILMLVMVYVATSDLSFAVEPDYYQKSLQWDDTSEQRRESEELGWSASIQVAESADLYKVRDIQCTLTDRSGEPIDGAEVDIIAFSHARGAERIALTLDPAGQGQYYGRMKVRRGGLWEFRIVVHRGDVVFGQVLEQRIATTRKTR